MTRNKTAPTITLPGFSSDLFWQDYDSKEYVKHIFKKKLQNKRNDKIIDGKLHLANDKDQTVVTIRLKYNIGSSGSIWASETMLLRREIPQRFVVSKSPYRYSSIPLRRFFVHVHDCLYHFQDMSMYEEIMVVTQKNQLQVLQIWN